MGKKDDKLGENLLHEKFVKKERSNSVSSQISSDKFNIPNKSIYWVYLIFFITAVFSNTAVSSFPVIEDSIKNEFHLQQNWKVGILTTSHFIGQIAGAICFWLVIEFNFRKKMIFTSILINLFAVLSFAFIRNYWGLLIIRFFNGACSICFAILNPVFIDQYCPKNSKSILMAIHQTESVIGNLVGVLLTSRILKAFSWRYSFIIQSIALLICLFIVILISKLYFLRTLHRLGDSTIFQLKEKKHNIQNENNNENPDSDNSISIKENQVINNKSTDSEEIQEGEKGGCCILNKNENMKKSFLNNVLENNFVEEENLKLSYWQILKKLFSNKVSLV